MKIKNLLDNPILVAIRNIEGYDDREEKLVPGGYTSDILHLEDEDIITIERAPKEEASWSSRVPVGRRFQVKSKIHLQPFQFGCEGKIGIAQIGFSEKYPIALMGHSFGTLRMCFHPSQLKELE